MALGLLHGRHPVLDVPPILKLRFLEGDEYENRRNEQGRGAGQQLPRFSDDSPGLHRRAHQLADDVRRHAVDGRLRRGLRVRCDRRLRNQRKDDRLRPAQCRICSDGPRTSGYALQKARGAERGRRSRREVVFASAPLGARWLAATNDPRSPPRSQGPRGRLPEFADV